MKNFDFVLFLVDCFLQKPIHKFDRIRLAPHSLLDNQRRAEGENGDGDDTGVEAQGISDDAREQRPDGITQVSPQAKHAETFGAVMGMCVLGYCSQNVG